MMLWWLPFAPAGNHLPITGAVCRLEVRWWRTEPSGRKRLSSKLTHSAGHSSTVTEGHRNLRRVPCWLTGLTPGGKWTSRHRNRICVDHGENVVLERLNANKHELKQIILLNRNVLKTILKLRNVWNLWAGPMGHMTRKETREWGNFLSNFSSAHKSGLISVQPNLHLCTKARFRVN